MASKARPKAPPKKERWLRLERGEDGPKKRFWEIARDGETVSVRFGLRVDEGRRIDKRLPSVDAAKREVEALVAEKRTAGYAERIHLEPQSKTGVVARNAELEAAIDRDPEDLQGYLVYGDWLQAQRDPRGELIAVQRARMEDPASNKLELAEDALFKRYGRELLGPLDKYRTIVFTYRSIRGFLWKLGFIHSARLRRMSPKPLSAIVKLLLEHPSGRFLQRLVLGRPIYGQAEEKDYGAVFDILGNHAPATLRWIHLGDGDLLTPYAPNEMRLGALFRALPSLRRLVVDGRVESFGEAPIQVEAMMLRQTNDATLAALATVGAEKLVELDVRFDAAPTTIVGLRHLIASGAPRLEHISIRAWVPGDYLTFDGIAEVLVAAPSAVSMTLDFPMSAAGAKCLLSHKTRLGRLAALRIRGGSINDAAVRRSLSAELPCLEWTESPEEIDEGELR